MEKFWDTSLNLLSKDKMALLQKTGLVCLPERSLGELCVYWVMVLAKAFVSSHYLQHNMLPQRHFRPDLPSYNKQLVCRIPELDSFVDFSKIAKLYSISWSYFKLRKHINKLIQQCKKATHLEWCFLLDILSCGLLPCEVTVGVSWAFAGVCRDYRAGCCDFCCAHSLAPKFALELDLLWNGRVLPSDCLA